MRLGVSGSNNEPASPLDVGNPHRYRLKGYWLCGMILLVIIFVMLANTLLLARHSYYTFMLIGGLP